MYKVAYWDSETDSQQERDATLEESLEIAARVGASLSAAKESKNQEINEARLAANRTHFLHMGKFIACDELSRSDIDAIAGSVALFGTFPAGFPNAWKAEDNSILPLPDIASFKDMYASMVNQGNVNFAHSQQLKQRLANAVTLDDVKAITW